MTFRTKLLNYIIFPAIVFVFQAESHAATQIGFAFSRKTKLSVKNKTIKRINQKFDVDVKLLQSNELSESETLKSYGIIFTDMELISVNKFKTLHEYVKNGGFLVGLGNFAKWLDVNDNDVLDKGIDTRARKESIELTGCAIMSSNLSIERIRNLSNNPILRNFYINKWIPYPLYKYSASSLKIENGAIPLAEARYQPFGYQKKDFTYNYWDTRFKARYESYITAKVISKGVVVRIAESLFMVPDKGLFNALWRNLLEESSYRELLGRIPDIENPEIRYEYNSLIPNLDFEEICNVQRKDPKGSNILTGSFIMPAAWQFNSWYGKYYAKVEKLKNKTGDYVLVMGSDDSDSRGGGAVWRADCNQTSLIPGKSYKMSITAKGENITSSNFSITLQAKNGKRISYRKELPSESFDWQEFNHEFKVPVTYQGDNALKRGITANVSFTGPGKFSVDHFVLTEIQ